MQWLIDLIIDTIGVPPCYIDRGDPAAYDFEKADLTQDGAAHELDLSAIVPEGATAVSMLLVAKHNNIGELVGVRKHGNANWYAAAKIYTLVAGAMVAQNFIVAVDADRKIDYMATPPPWVTLYLVVNGWWL